VDFPDPTLPIIDKNSPGYIFKFSIIKAYLFFYGDRDISASEELGNKLSLKLP
jgi:hypothetical protein